MYKEKKSTLIFTKSMEKSFNFPSHCFPSIFSLFIYLWEKKTKKIQMYKCIDNVKVYDLLENKVHKKTIINATISVLPQTINICYSPPGRSILGKTVPEVLILKTEGTVCPNMD